MKHPLLLMQVINMIPRIILVITFIFAAIKGHGQVDSLNFGPEPIGGVNKIALEYYKIDFTKEQREVLRGVEIEFIYSIGTDGVATLEEINGISDPGILDSLQQVTPKLPRFYPLTVNGIQESSLYFLKLQFPTYRRTENRTVLPHTLWYKPPKYEDFEYIHKSGDKMDVLIGGMVNSFSGLPADYLQAGGGMKIDVVVIGRNGLGGGLVMGMYGNKLRQEYPIHSIREQFSIPPTLLVGAALLKTIAEKERSELNIQLELNYAIQNITPRLDYQDKDWVQLRGFSPGIIGNYLIQLGGSGTSLYYGNPTVINHYLNIHGAIRPVFFNLKEATGLMWELGLSYRFRSHFVDEYRLKPEFSR